MADQDKLAELVAKEEIRELAMLYSRGVDRKDGDLLRSLYTKDGIDRHDETYEGDATGYVDFLEQAFPHMPYSGHHICNHLISVDLDADGGGEGEGEVYAIAYHVIPGRQGGFIEDMMCVRYIDRYRKEEGRWLFAERVVRYDYRSQRPLEAAPRPMPVAEDDPSVKTLSHRLFMRGSRA